MKLNAYLLTCTAAAAAVQAHVNSKKYQQLVRDSGEPAPAPVIMVRQQREEQQAEAEGAAGPAAQAPAGVCEGGRLACCWKAFL